MKTAILLGAGSSLPARFPSTQCLTDLVLSGDGVERHSDGTYYLKGCAPPAGGTVGLANRMVRRLHAEAVRYCAAYLERRPNYEDPFYLASQTSDEELGETENPAIDPFISELRAEISPLVAAANASNEDPDEPYEPGILGDFPNLLDETGNYISDVVWRSLCHKPASTDHLKIFVEACRTGWVTGIATLSHDTHVETHLRTEGISLADGFSDEEAGVRYWTGDLYSRARIPFLKLHGSVDWFRLRPRRSGPWYDDRIGIPLNGDYSHTRTKDGDWQDALDGRPLLLIGTFNKVAQYSQGIFLDLHHRFRSILHEADRLLVCGYSFGDKGINTAVIEWYYGRRGRSLLIIHPNHDVLVSNARGAIRNRWEGWCARRSVDLLAKPLERVDADDIFTRFRETT